MSNPQVLLQQALLAQKAKRHDDVLNLLKDLIKQKKYLDEDELLLLIGTIKYTFSMKVLILGTLTQKLKVIEIKNLESSQYKKEIILNYHRKIENELRTTCSELVPIFEDHLIAFTDEPKPLILYHRLIGDIFRLVVEFCEGDEYKSVMRAILICYNKALEIAEAHLEPDHPVRLSVIKSFVTLYCDVWNQPSLALSFFKDAALKIKPLNRKVKEHLLTTVYNL